MFRVVDAYRCPSVQIADRFCASPAIRLRNSGLRAVCVLPILFRHGRPVDSTRLFSRRLCGEGDWFSSGHAKLQQRWPDDGRAADTVRIASTTSHADVLSAAASAHGRCTVVQTKPGTWQARQTQRQQRRTVSLKISTMWNTFDVMNISSGRETTRYRAPLALARLHW